MINAKPLEGVRVLSLEQVHVLPWGTAFLADFGAQVVRVESAEHMNDRRSGPFPEGTPGEEWWNECGTFAYWARNKQSICLQVAHPLGKETFLRLVENADVVTDNFRPGTTARYGLDHDSLAAVKPDIITLSCTAYGHTGPWRAYGARARTVDAACGLSYLTGYEGGPSLRASANYMDHTGGLNVAYALLLALYRKRKTGKGARIDLSMYETGVSCIAPAVLEAQRGVSRPRLGPSHLWKTPHSVYPCQGDDRWIAITVSNDDEWHALRRAMGYPAWAADGSLDTAQIRHARRAELDAHIAEWTAGQDSQELFHLLQSHGVPAGPVNTARDLVSDDHLWERGYFEVFDNPTAPRVGPRVFAGRPFRAPGIPLSLELSSALGQHNLDVLRDMGGLTDSEIQRLADEGVLSARPRTTDRPPADRPRNGASSRHYDPEYRRRAEEAISSAQEHPVLDGGRR